MTSRSAMVYRRPGSFTERSYRAIEQATMLAAEHRHAAVAPLHIAIALIRDAGSVAATSLHFHGLALDSLEHELATGLASLPTSDRATHPPLDAESEALLDQAAAEASALDHAYTGTEHILLAVLRDGESVAARTLARHGFTFEMAKARILYILNATVENQEPFIPPIATKD